MSSITVPLPDEDFAFLREWSKDHGTSPEAILAKQARNLREQLEKPLHPDVIAATGIFPSDVDVKQAHQHYLEKKHL